MALAVIMRDAPGDVTIRSMLPTEVPPYFWTISAMAVPSRSGMRAHAGADDSLQPLARNTSVAFVPPKPNEFDIAASIFMCARHARDVVEIALRILVEQIRGRRRDLIADREHREDRLDAAGGAEQCPVIDFVDLTASLLRVIAERALDRDALGDVAERRRGAVRVDVVDVVGVDAARSPARSSCCAPRRCRRPAAR